MRSLAPHASSAVVEVSVVSGAAHEDLGAKPVVDQHLLSLQLRPFDAEVHVNGRRAFAGRGPSGASHIVRPGDSARAVMSSAWEMLHVAIPDSTLKAVCEGEGRSWSGLELGELDCEYDATIISVGQALHEEILGQRPFGRLRLDALGTDLVVHLLRAHSNLGDRSGRLGPRRIPTLLPWQRRRATDFMAAHLADDLPLAAVAAECQLSSFHFARAFKSTVGESPHRHQVRLRIEKAKALLRDTDTSGAEIARVIGYQSGRALSRAFRAATGVTPRRFRQGVSRQPPEGVDVEM